MTSQEKEALEASFQKQSGRSRFIRIRWRIVIIVCGVFWIGWYATELLYGNYSRQILQELREQEQYLKQKVNQLQAQNVKLQKVIFELKGLEPNLEEKK